MPPAVGLAAFLGVGVLVHLLPTAVAGVAAGGRLEEVALFVGPVLLERRLGSVWVRIRLLPLGGFVRFHEAKPGAPPEERREGFSALHPVKRLLVALAGAAALFALAGALLGPAAAGETLLAGFGQVLRGAARPFSAGDTLAGRWLALVGRGEAPRALGILCGKLAALHLLPIPGLGGFDALQVLLRGRRPPLASPVPELGALALVLLLLGWVAAIARALAAPGP